MADPSGWPGMAAYTERRNTAARLRAAAAIVATRGHHQDALADWLDDLAAQYAPEPTTTEEDR